MYVHVHDQGPYIFIRLIKTFVVSVKDSSIYHFELLNSSQNNMLSHKYHNQIFLLIEKLLSSTALLLILRSKTCLNIQDCGVGIGETDIIMKQRIMPHS